MALIKFGHLVADARGKLNGTVFSRGRGGAIMRSKVTPLNPATNFQSLVRGNLANLAQTWRALTDAQRAAWASFASDLNTSNIFGDAISLSGINAYMLINRHLATIGMTTIFDPPSLATVSQLTALSAAAAAGAGTFTVTFAPAPVPANHKLVIECSPQTSPGVSAFKGRQTVIKVVDAAGASPANIAAEYVAKYGSLTAGRKISVAARFVHKTSGISGVALTTTVTVAA